jgi:putative transposase
MSAEDYERFQELLYIANNTDRSHRSDLLKNSHSEIFVKERKSPLVEIGAYALMPNHFHLLIKQKIDGGISSFMRKVGTGYTMYFNIKNERVGNLFVKPFRSKLVDEDLYLRKVFAYISMNPRELAPSSKNKLEAQREFLSKYRFSSFMDYAKGNNRPQVAILDEGAMDLLSTFFSNPVTMLREAEEFGAQVPMSR